MERFPRLRVATMTGHADRTRFEGSDGRENRPTLFKPFLSADLAAAMHSIFETDAGGRSSR